MKNRPFCVHPVAVDDMTVDNNDQGIDQALEKERGFADRAG